jgi:hypothetical protein
VHVLDIRKIDELLDLIAVGNIIEFATALDHRTYQDVEVSAAERMEQEIAMTRYRTFIRWFMKRFVLMIRDRPVNAAYLFKRRLLSIATTLGHYVSREHSTVQKIDHVTGLTPAGVKRMIRHHIQQNWCDLLPAYDEMASAPSLLLYYVGPPITIVEKTPDYIAKVQYLKVVEDLDVKEAPIYLYNVSQGETPRNADPTAEKRAHPGGSTSPSTSTVQKRRK